MLRFLTTSSVPNKPVLPTAPTRPTEYPPDPLRRQTGQPLDSPEEQRATSFEEQETGHGQRTTSDAGWAASYEQRATSGGLRVAGCEWRNRKGARDARATRAVMWVDSLGSNKPVLPTALDWPNADPLDPLRRQTGQSLGSFEGNGRTPQTPSIQAGLALLFR